MKITVHSCIESMFFEATENLSKAVEKHKKTLKAYLDNNVSANCLNSVKNELNLASQRMYELSIAKKIIDEIEQKGVEI